MGWKARQRLESEKGDHWLRQRACEEHEAGLVLSQSLSLRCSDFYPEGSGSHRRFLREGKDVYVSGKDMEHAACLSSLHTTGFGLSKDALRTHSSRDCKGWEGPGEREECPG